MQHQQTRFFLNESFQSSKNRGCIFPLPLSLTVGAGELRNRRAKVVFSYTPDNDDELRLEVNDIIEILGEEEEGWWRGKVKGKDKEGVFPTNYVKLIDATAAENVHSRPESRNDVDENKSKTAADSGWYNVT